MELLRMSCDNDTGKMRKLKKNVCVKLSSMGRQGDFLFNLVIGMSLHFNLCNYRYNFNFTSN